MREMASSTSKVAVSWPKVLPSPAPADHRVTIPPSYGAKAMALSHRSPPPVVLHLAERRRWREMGRPQFVPACSAAGYIAPVVQPPRRGNGRNTRRVLRSGRVHTEAESSAMAGSLLAAQMALAFSMARFPQRWCRSPRLHGDPAVCGLTHHPSPERISGLISFSFTSPRLRGSPTRISVLSPSAARSRRFE